MLGHATPKPKLLASKLLAIRQTYGLTQAAMAQVLELKATRISEFETGRRLPNLILLLWYSWYAGVAVNLLIDDELTLEEFKKHLEWVRVRSTPSYRL
jgi:transcriptional regulator with XRE-family HTH domain